MGVTRKADLCNLSGFCDDKLKRSCCKRSTAFGRENKRRVGRALQGTKRAKFCAVQILHTAVAFLQSVYMQAACREIYLTPAQRDELAHTKTVPVSQALFCSSFDSSQNGSWSSSISLGKTSVTRYSFGCDFSLFGSFAMSSFDIGVFSSSGNETMIEAADLHVQIAEPSKEQRCSDPPASRTERYNLVVRRSAPSGFDRHTHAPAHPLENRAAAPGTIREKLDMKVGTPSRPKSPRNTSCSAGLYSVMLMAGLRG